MTFLTVEAAQFVWQQKRICNAQFPGLFQGCCTTVSRLAGDTICNTVAWACGFLLLHDNAPAMLPRVVSMLVKMRVCYTSRSSHVDSAEAVEAHPMLLYVCTFMLIEWLPMCEERLGAALHMLELVVHADAGLAVTDVQNCGSTSLGCLYTHKESCGSVTQACMRCVVCILKFFRKHVTCAATSAASLYTRGVPVKPQKRGVPVTCVCKYYASWPSVRTAMEALAHYSKYQQQVCTTLTACSAAAACGRHVHTMRRAYTCKKMQEAAVWRLCKKA